MPSSLGVSAVSPADRNVQIVTAHSPLTVDDRRVRRYLAASAISALLLVFVYLAFVRTGWGQRFDDIAFDGREVEDPAITRATNDLLHSVTRSSLVLLTGAVVLLALARRRWRLALVAGASISGAVVTTEVLKLHVLTRPDLDGIAGIDQNSFPSGHATIGMALSLGFVMVSPHSWRWLSALAALFVSMIFGIGVLATGWHRPSDTVGAYLVCVAWFGLGTAVLLSWRGAGDEEMGQVEARLDRRAAAVGGLLVVAMGALILVETFSEDGIRTVEFAIDYLVVAVAILAMAGVIVIGYHQSLRGVSLDPHQNTVRCDHTDAPPVLAED